MRNGTTLSRHDASTEARVSLVRFLATTLTLAALILASTPVAAAGPENWRREGWQRTDFSKAAIQWTEILSGGPPKDGIPSIDNPSFVGIEQENAIAAEEPVIGLSLQGEARAYPIRILMWHEIVNDTVAGIPVAVTYCPLCNSAVVFKRKTSRGVTTFGTTGKLRNSDLVMYDRRTETWWQQFTGEAIVGELTGEELEMIPARLESFASFKERFPNGRVLVPNDPSLRQYGRNPYQGYDTSKVPFLYNGEFREGVEPMARVVVVREGNSVFGLTMNLLRKVGQVRNGDIVVSWRSGQSSALDHHTVAGGRDVGNVVVQKMAASGRHVDVPYDVTFAFAFHAFHPESALLQT
ncbi:MAG: DUF3179 domain-containing protein, partial [Alphaproteobacteria bacterium]|nr:DUF3179 domain-containing protein [Alphaproteobacteria bacterium]